MSMRVNPEALRALRERTGFSIADFAGEVGTVPSHISNIEAGRRGASPDAIRRMAQVLKVPMSALLWDEPGEVA
jgi:transcriptional regulator with XRE-family HTH domain